MFSAVARFSNHRLKTNVVRISGNLFGAPAQPGLQLARQNMTVKSCSFII